MTKDGFLYLCEFVASESIYDLQDFFIDNGMEDMIRGRDSRIVALEFFMDGRPLGMYLDWLRSMDATAPAEKVKPGAVGVMLDDLRDTPRMFRLLDHSRHMGLAYFEPLDDVGTTVGHPIRQFWPLLDRMPS
jgi:hypothetical protein